METTLPPVDVVHAILDTLASSGGSMKYVDLLNALPRYTNLYYYLRLALSDGYMSGDLSANSRLRLTDKGWLSLYERSFSSHQRNAEHSAENQRREDERQKEAVRLKERQEDIAREEKQNKIQNRLGYLDLLLSFAGFAAGVFVEYRVQLVEILKELTVKMFG